MSNKEIRQKAKQDREKAHIIIEKYVKDENRDKSKDEKSGQMKFLVDGLLIRHLAVNTRKRVYKGLKRMTTHMDQTIFAVDEDVIEFSDKEKLLQKAQREMELSFVSYFHCDELKAMAQTVDKKKVYKETKYFNFLMSTALYEIFILEYHNEVCGKYDLDKYRYMEVAEELEQLLKEFQELLNKKEKAEQFRSELPKLQEKMKQYQADMDEFFEAMTCMHLYMIHLRNLYAMLRVIADIEFIQINEGRNTKGKERLEAKDKAHVLYKTYETEVSYCLERNRNLGVLFNQFNQMYANYLDKNLEHHKYYQEIFEIESEPVLIKKYIRLIEKKVSKSLTEEEVVQMEAMADVLAGYMSFAENDILEIQKRAKK